MKAITDTLPGQQDGTTWKNRIVDEGTESPDQLLANPLQWKIHPRYQQDALAAVLDKVGWVKEVIVNRRTGNMLDGHLRVILALRHGEKQVPVKYVDITEEEEVLILAVLDPLAGLAVADNAKLRELHEQIKNDDAAIQAMLDSIKEEAGILDVETPLDDPGAQVDKAEELREKWGVELGQLWQLGEHRLICGDCTDKDVVGRVMENALSSLVVIDPPYGVEYADKNKFLNAISRGNRIQTPIEGDSGTKEDIQAMWKRAFSEMEKVMEAGAVVYCFMPQGGDQMMMMMMMTGAGIEPRHELIWLKNNHVLGRVDYAYKHEPILYAWKAGGHKFYGDFQTSILEYPKPQKSDKHPTTKPIELIERLVSNSSKQGQIVYDGFVGSGTTLGACQRLNRKCRAVEISPAYCAVTIERFYQMTGIDPALLGNG